MAIFIVRCEPQAHERLKSEIRNLRLDGIRDSPICDFGLEMQDSSDFKFIFKTLGAGVFSLQPRRFESSKEPHLTHIAQ